MSLSMLHRCTGQYIMAWNWLSAALLDCGGQSHFQQAIQAHAFLFNTSITLCVCMLARAAHAVASDVPTVWQ